MSRYLREQIIHGINVNAFCHILSIDACPLSLKMVLQNPTASIIPLFLPSIGGRDCSWSRWPSWEDSEDPAHSLEWWSWQPLMGCPVNGYKWPGPWGKEKVSGYKSSSVYLCCCKTKADRVGPTWHDNLLLVEGLLMWRSVLPHCITRNKIKCYSKQFHKISNSLTWAFLVFCCQCSPIHALVLSVFAIKRNENLIAEGFLSAAVVLRAAVLTVWPGGCAPAHDRPSCLDVWHLPYESFMGH